MAAGIAVDVPRAMPATAETVDRDGAEVVGVHGVFVDEEVPEPEGLCGAIVGVMQHPVAVAADGEPCRAGGTGAGVPCDRATGPFRQVGSAHVGLRESVHRVLARGW